MDHIMAYNYSPWLLEVNKELVLTLIDLADTKGQASKTFDTAHEAKVWRHKVSELLANLARNNSSRAYVRATVRTWIRWAGERYVVFVGVPGPTDVVRGAPAGLPVSVMSERSFNDRLVISEPITGENWPSIGVKLAVAKVTPQVNYIEIVHPPPKEGIVIISQTLDPEFTLVHSHPTAVWDRTSKAARSDTSATIALPDSDQSG